MPARRRYALCGTNSRGARGRRRVQRRDAELSQGIQPCLGREDGGWNLKLWMARKAPAVSGHLRNSQVHFGQNVEGTHSCVVGAFHLWRVTTPTTAGKEGMIVMTMFRGRHHRSSKEGMAFQVGKSKWPEPVPVLMTFHPTSLQSGDGTAASIFQFQFQQASHKSNPCMDGSAAARRNRPNSIFHIPSRARHVGMITAPHREARSAATFLRVCT